MKMKKIALILLFLAAIAPLTAQAALMNSSSYQLTSAVVSSGGANVTSSSYKTNFNLGTIIGNITSALYKLFLGFWYTLGGAVPTANMSSPLDNWYVNSTIVFECDISDSDGDLDNITLYHNYSGSFIQNVTADISGSSYSANWIVDGFNSEKTFIWNCYACDTSRTTDGCAFDSANRTLTVDLVQPSIYFQGQTPINNTRNSTANNFAYINVSASDASNNYSAFIDWNRSLVGYWRLEGNYDDSSSWDNDGSCTNCPNLTTGYRGKAFEFDGVDDYVNVSDGESLDIIGSISISLWFYANNIDSNLISNRFNYNGNEFGYNLQTEESGKVVWCSHDGNSNANTDAVAISSNAITINSWNHIAITKAGDSTTVYFYINGESAGTDTVNATAIGYSSSFMNRTIGASFDPIGYTYSGTTAHFGAKQYTNGTIDEVMIFDRALSAEEINASYQAGVNSLYHNFTNLSSGTYTYTAYAVDQAGNLNETEERIFRVNYPPTAPNVTYPEDGKNYSDIPHINYSSTDEEGDSINYSIYINGTLNITTNVNVTDWNASDGYYNLTVSAWDGMDSSANSSVIHFRLDTVAPSWNNNQSNLTTDNRINYDVWFYVNWSDNIGLSHYVFSWNGTNSSWVNDTVVAMTGIANQSNVTKTINLTRGNTIGYRFYANDSAGNWDYTDIWTFVVNNTPPSSVNLSYPNGTITNTTPRFNWTNATDADGDTIYYDIFINLIDAFDDREGTGLSHANYTPSPPLKYYSDDGYKYEWWVRAYDGIDYGENSSKFNFSISSRVMISLPIANVSFGEMEVNEQNDTTDDAPQPIVIQNDGNCYINVNLTVDSYLWDTKQEESSYFQFKIDNVTVSGVPAENGSFNSSASATSWTNFSTTNSTGIYQFNYSDDGDSAEIDINITVPADEPPGDKTSTILFTGYYVTVT